MRRSLVTLLLLSTVALLGQNQGIRPSLLSLEFPLANSPVIYGIIGGAQGIRTAARSDDGGRNWVSLYVAPQGNPQNVGQIVVHPDRPRIVYAVLARARGGLFRSEDSGATWQPFTQGLPPAGEIREVFILRGSGEDPRLRIADTLYQLDSSARNWIKAADLPINTTSLGMNIRNPQRMGVLGLGGTYFQSTNGGASWEFLTTLIQDAFRTGLQIEFDPKDQNTVFVRTESLNPNSSNCPAPAGSLWRSTNGGRNFAVSYESGACNVSPTVFVDPQRQQAYLRIGFLGTPYCLSRNSGGSFDCVQDPGTATTPSLIGMDPRDGTLYRGTSLVSRDGAATWQPFEASFRPTLPNVAPVTVSLTEGESTAQSVTVGTAEGVFSPAPLRAAVTSGSEWLALQSTTSSLNDGLRIQVNAQNLQPGTYTGIIRIEADQTVNTSSTFQVRLTVPPRALTGIRYNFTRLSGGSANNGRPIQDNVPASGQPMTNVTAVARDSQGNVFVMADRRLRRIDTNGRITTVAGTGANGTTTDNTPALQAQFAFPNSVAVGQDGTLYVGESNRIYGIRDGVVRVLADNTFITVPGTFPSRLSGLKTILRTPSGSILATDGRTMLRLNGLQPPEILYQINVPANAFLGDMTAVSDSVFYYSDSLNHRIYRSNGGALSVYAGTGTQGLSGDGGPARSANLNRPTKLAVDSEGNLIFYAGDRFRLVRPDGRIFTISGSRGFSGVETEGIVGDVSFTSISGLAIEPNDNLLVADFSGVYRFTRQPFATPAIQSGAAVNGGSFGPRLSPGSLFTLYGANLSLETRAVNFLPVPPALGGAEVLVNGAPVPILYASPGQVNAQLPPNLAPGTYQLQARVDGRVSSQIEINVAAAAPGIFTYGDDRAVAQNQDNSVNGESSPELPGRYCVLYLTGAGATDAPVAAGAAALADPLSRVLGEVELTIGGRRANVLFAGLTPGLVGVAQINFQVPDLPPGDHPIVVKIGGAESNAPKFRVGGN